MAKIGSRFIIVVLTMILILVGCSGNGGNGGGDEKDAPSSNNGGGSSANGNDNDGTGAKKRGSITVSIYDNGSIPAEEGTAEENRWTRWLNENGPVDVKFVAVPRSESLAKFTSMFAAGNAPDLIFEYDTSFRNQLIDQKQLMPLDDLIENHSVEYKKLIERFPVLKEVSMRPDGNMYEFGRIKPLRPNHTLWIRADWLENLGLEVPQTTEELFKVAEAFTKMDPDGNNQHDTIGIGLAHATRPVLNNTFQAVDWYVDSEGELKRAWDQLQAVTEFMKRLYEAGLTEPDFVVDTNGETRNQLFITGKIGILGVNTGVSQAGYDLFSAFKKNNPDGKIMAIPLPESPFGRFSPVIDNPLQMTAAINANAADPEAVMAYVDFLVREETQMTMHYGIEGEHYRINEAGCPETIDPEKNKLEQSWTSFYRMLVSESVLGECANFINRMDPNDPIDKEFIEILKQSDEAYLSPERPMANIAHVEHMPTLPAELQLTVANTKKDIEDMMLRAVVSGNSYTVEQAISDAKALWYGAGGQKVEDWMAEWYRNNKDTAFLTEKMYDLR